MRTTYTAAFIVLTLVLFLSACGQAAAPVTASPSPTGTPLRHQVNTIPPPRSPAATSPQAVPATLIFTPLREPSATLRVDASLTPTVGVTDTTSPTRTPALTMTPSPTPSLGAARTATEIPSPTFAVGAEPTLFPMSIDAMRQVFYPGSEILIDEELDAGANYRRYYAYYLSEGYKIYALLTIPDGDVPAGGWPAIVFNHGYIPPAEYRTTERYIDYVDRLARSGYIVFRIDYRGHDNSEGEARGAYGDPGYTVDVLNAVASLRQFADVNPDKIGMWGHSMGGYLTLRSMVISQEVRVGVIWAGVVAAYPALLYNWPMGPLVPPANSREWMEDWPAQFGSPQESPTFWDSISANSYLADLSGPLQLHHGTRDSDVPVQFSEMLAEQVSAAGGDMELYIYEGDNHNLTNYFNLAMDRSIAFFDAVLK